MLLHFASLAEGKKLEENKLLEIQLPIPLPSLAPAHGSNDGKGSVTGQEQG